MTKLTQQLTANEAKYLSRFYAACKDMFVSCHMPSHDETHHLRVWVYCKQLLSNATLYGYSFSNDFIEGLLAATMFHDIGLSRITDERHGPEGAALFKQYIAANSSIKLDLLDDVVEAIGVHDLKNPSSLSQAFDLASILTICDNLDSFGYIGAYRYAEIYLIRGVERSKVASQSMSNIEKRFKSFELHYAHLTELYQEQKHRYKNACSVFSNIECMDELMAVVQRLSIEEKLNIPEVVAIYTKKSSLTFWSLLREELRNFEMHDNNIIKN